MVDVKLNCLRCGKTYTVPDVCIEHIGYTQYSYCEDCLHEAVRAFTKQGEQADNVNHPAHYQGKHECIDEMIALFGVEDVKAFCRCNVYKYRYRASRKGGQEDLDKADWYMDKLMELEGEKQQC